MFALTRSRIVRDINISTAPISKPSDPLKVTQF